MNKYKIGLTTKQGHYLEIEITAPNMLDLVQPLVYELAVEHKIVFDDVVELDISEVP
jgi:hypothetical protein